MEARWHSGVMFQSSWALGEGKLDWGRLQNADFLLSQHVNYFDVFAREQFSEKICSRGIALLYCLNPQGQGTGCRVMEDLSSFVLITPMKQK